MTTDLVTVTPSTSAHEALTEMVRQDVGHLPVVDEKDPRKLVGFVTRTDLIGVERRRLDEEAPQEREFANVLRWRRKGPNL
jgi:CBS-domain-containing membrane protein